MDGAGAGTGAKSGTAGSRAATETQRGHDFVRSDDGTVQVDVALVNTLLSERMQAKYRRDYDAADKVRDQLKAMGVHCHDGDKSWKAVQLRRPSAMAGSSGGAGAGAGAGA